MIRRFSFAAAAVAALLLFAPQSAEAAPKADLWPKWAAHDAASTTIVDHQAWGAFLKYYLVVGEDGINRITYGKVSAADKVKLKGYIDYLSAQTPTRLNRNEQFAYWVNFYNALTIKVILDHYPVKSILDIDISPGFFSIGPWGKKLVTVEGEKLSLDDIEHRILRPVWKDPRIHYAVNCASIGCPDLQPVPFIAARLEPMLDAAARDYIGDGRGVFFDGDRLGLSSIYKWFADDFGRNDREIIEHIAKYAPPALKSRLDGREDIGVFTYNWDLNEER